MINEQDKTVLTKLTQVAKKIVYEPQRAKALSEMMGSAQGVVQAVMAVVGGVEQLTKVPDNLRPMLAANTLVVMVDLAQEVEGKDLPPEALMTLMDQVMKAAAPGASAQQAQPQDAQEPMGMLAKMQAGEDPEEPGDAPGPDNTAAHEGAESAPFEKSEGSEEDPNEGMLAKMRRGVPA